jgi:hypothetical protein
MLHVNGVKHLGLKPIRSRAMIWFARELSMILSIFQGAEANPKIFGPRPCTSLRRDASQQSLTI